MSTRLGGRYQLVRELGAGGMGRVFQAVDTETGRAVAAKIMLATSEDNLDALLRFQQEGAVLSTLKHPNIVEVYGTFLEEHTSCIIMELLEGQSLAQILRSERLSLPRVKKLAEQTTSALAYAHGRAIVHRDIKPDNIMVVGDDHVKVTDFGIARILRTGATLNTAAGMSMGTPLYMAPEQIEGQKVDGRADLYSFGAVVYQMVTGQPPFEGDDPLTIAFKHVHKEPRKPKELAADIPDDWEAVILKCLAKDPGERYQTATALHDAIAALGSDGSSPASTGHSAPTWTPPPPPSSSATRPDTIDAIINPEITGAGAQTGQVAQNGDWQTSLDSAAATGNNPGATVIGPVDNGQNGFGPGSGRTTMAPANGHAMQGTVIQPAVPGYNQQPQTSPTFTAPPAVGPTHATPVAPPERRRRPIGIIVGGALAALLVLGGGAYAFTKDHGKSTTNTTPATTSNALALSVAGTKHGNGYASGQTVKLAWTADKAASQYRVQVAKNSAFIAGKISTTRATSSALSVVGAQTYYWRLREKVGGTWGAWTTANQFNVAKPAMSTTYVVSPANGSSQTTTRVRLAWSAAKGAVSYKLSVAGKTQTVRGTSTQITLKPGTYGWSVTPQFRGAHLYSGAATRARFTIKQTTRKQQPKQSSNPQPVNPQPVNPQPVNPQPVNPQPVNPQPVNPQPVNPAPAPAPANPAPAPAPANPCAVSC